VRDGYRELLEVCCLLWLIGCASGGERLPREITPEEVVRIASAHLDALSDFRCEAKVVVQDADGRRQSALTTIVFRAPDRLRVEAINLLGIPLMTLLTRGDSVFFYLPSEHRVLEATVANGALERFIGLDFEKMSAGAFFLGIPRLTHDDLRQMDRLSREGNLCTMRFVSHRGVREIQIDLRYVVIVEEAIYTPDGLLLGRRVARDYHRVDKVYAPRQITITRGEGGRVPRRADRRKGGPPADLMMKGESITFHFTSFQVNRGVPDAVFKLHLPKGVIRGQM
jgi:outer membrane lipoprotein-sorting protein